MKLLGVIGLSMLSFAVMAQTSTVDSVMQHVSGHKLSVGGYGEVAYSRNYYSDNYYRYSNPSKYKDDKSNGRFDIPHGRISADGGWQFITTVI